MTPEQIHTKLKEKFGDAVLDFNEEVLDPYIKITPEKTFEIAKFLKDDPELSFDALMCLSGMDYGADTNLGVVYNLHSMMKQNHKITIRVDVPRDKPTVPSVEKVWRTADWHEREAYDLMGIHFEGHRVARLRQYEFFHGLKYLT